MAVTPPGLLFADAAIESTAAPLLLARARARGSGGPHGHIAKNSPAVKRKLKHILLASHGSRGARAAERSALALASPGTVLHHFIVVPDLWKGMMGDDWLNNASTRDTYGRYLEAELAREIRVQVRRLQREAQRRRLAYRVETVFGKPAQCLAERLKRGDVDLAVIGSPRPRRITGLRSRMLTDKVLQSAAVPLLVVPYPADG